MKADRHIIAESPDLPCPALPCPALPLPPHAAVLTCRHSSGSIAKLTRRLTSMSEGHSMEIDAAQPQHVPQSDALIDGFTVPEVRLLSCLLLNICFYLNEQSCPS